MTVGWASPSRRTATTEFVVPRSIPTAALLTAAHSTGCPRETRQGDLIKRVGCRLDFVSPALACCACIAVAALLPMGSYRQLRSWLVAQTRCCSLTTLVQAMICFLACAAPDCTLDSPLITATTVRPRSGAPGAAQRVPQIPTLVVLEKGAKPKFERQTSPITPQRSSTCCVLNLLVSERHRTSPKSQLSDGKTPVVAGSCGVSVVSPNSLSCSSRYTTSTIC
jgi:hypothetical protein